VRFGQGHHIRHWAHGGPTTLSNLALLCRRHHRAVHEEGYQLDRQPDGELRFRRPDGQLLAEVPHPPEVRGNPVEILRARNEADALHLHARTAIPGCAGRERGVRRPATSFQISSLTSTASPRAWTRPSSTSTTRTGRIA